MINIITTLFKSIKNKLLARLHYYYQLLLRRTLVRSVQYATITAAVLIVCMLSSCEKVIDLDLSGVEKKYVVEAYITDQAGTAKVMVSKTSNFDDNNNFPGISDAIVTITETGGATTTLIEGNTGVYEAPALTGTSGKTYTLTVKTGTETFTAVSTMPQKINLDTIYITNELIFSDFRKIVNTEFSDPAGRGNNYRFIQYINGRKENQVLIQNDEYTDGKKITNRLFYFSDDDKDYIKSGDEVKIDMLCIDAATYKYWFSLDRSATGGNNQATPSNPVSNMQGGALGYFSAQTLQTKSMIAP